MAVLDAIHTKNRFPRASFASKIPRVWFFQSLNLNIQVQITDIYCCFFSRVNSLLCNQNNWWTLRLLNRFLFFCSQITFYSSYEVMLSGPKWILSFDVAIGCEETLLAGLGVKKLRRSSQYEPVTLNTFLCEIQAAFLVSSSTLKVHSNDLSLHVGAFGFRWFWDPVWMTPNVGPKLSLLRTYLFTKWWSLTRYWVLSSDWSFRSCIRRSSFDGMSIAIDDDLFFS